MRNANMSTDYEELQHALEVAENSIVYRNRMILVLNAISSSRAKEIEALRAIVSSRDEAIEVLLKLL